jgi:hypothetical protein
MARAAGWKEGVRALRFYTPEGGCAGNAGLAETKACKPVYNRRVGNEREPGTGHCFLTSI